MYPIRKMYTLKHKKEIKSYLQYLLECTRELANVASKDIDCNKNFTITKEGFKEVADMSTTIQQCVLCESVFILGEGIEDLFCEKSENRLHIGNVFGKMVNQTLASVVFRLRAVPYIYLIKQIELHYANPKKEINESDRWDENNSLEYKRGGQKRQLELYMSKIYFVDNFKIIEK